MTYASYLRRLYAINQGHPVKLGLENTLQLYSLLNKPASKIPIIHVAGTNGKGSVCVKISEVLHQSGYKTGLFTSPHISTFRERIQVNATLMKEDDFMSILSDILPLCEHHHIPATFFEISTIMGLLHFERMKCDAIFLEVGLGGRLDSTNIVTPHVSVITSIQMDHMGMLGNSLEEIARAKAGIMKPNVNALVGPQCPMNIMKEEAKLSKCKLYELNHVLRQEERRYKSSDGNDDDIDKLNADLAHAALKLLQQSTSAFNHIPKSALEQGLKSQPPCRFQVVKYTKTNLSAHNHGGSSSSEIDVIFDIAHNKDAVAALMRKMKTLYPNTDFRIVLGMSADKDISEVISEILKFVPSNRIHCTEARSNRAMSARDLRTLISSLTGHEHSATLVTSTDSDSDNDDANVELAVQKAVAKVPSGGAVLVCGTTFIMASARAAVGIIEPRDSAVLSSAASSIGSDAQENFTRMM